MEKERIFTSSWCFLANLYTSSSQSFLSSLNTLMHNLHRQNFKKKGFTIISWQQGFIKTRTCNHKKNLCKPGSCLIFSFLHQRFQKSSSNILKCIKWNTTCKSFTALKVKWDCWQKRVKKSSLFSSSYFIVLTVYHVILMNIFLYSHHISAWYCIHIERRFSVLIIQGSKNLRVYIRGKRPKKVNLIQVYCVIMRLGVLPLLLVGRLIHLQISPLHFNRFSYQFYLLQSLSYTACHKTHTPHEISHNMTLHLTLLDQSLAQ